MKQQETSFFIPGKGEIGALPSKGLTKDHLGHCDGCHLRVRPPDGNRGRATIKGPPPPKGPHSITIQRKPGLSDEHCWSA